MAFSNYILVLSFSVQLRVEQLRTERRDACGQTGRDGGAGADRGKELLC